jgi:Arc/MetJ-type ribon-helix-helix transcriptional regulator
MKIKLTLPAALSDGAKLVTERGGFSDIEEYVRSLIRADLECRGLLEGGKREALLPDHAQRGAGEPVPGSPLISQETARIRSAHTPSLWRDAVLNALMRFSTRHGTKEIRRSHFLAEELDALVRQTHSRGRTPEMTVSRVLQELRDAGAIEFISKGRYRLLEKG